MPRLIRQGPRALDLSGEGILLARAIPQRPCHVSHSTFRAILNDGGNLGSAAATVALVHVLNDFLASARFEVNVDIWLFISQRRQKTLEGKVVINRINRSDVQQKTHRRIGRGSATLTENPLGASEAHNVVHDDKVPGKVFTLDELQFFINTLPHLG